ncbi:hypothetical protein ACFVAQ_45880 [Streptomyces sp. NPDC057651]|uniref:hypothetical protein n=1 Tax=Streptomyces sp. NPDC057651 TaxID=3346194 RepID=UPI0036BFC0E1
MDTNDTTTAAEQITYAIRGARTKMTGHYRRPGTRQAYGNCGPIGAPNAEFATLAGWKLCARCVKAEAADRVAAEQVIADRAIDGPTLAERAGMRYCLVGTGRRVHYSNNDDTLCGREVTEYTDGLDDRRNSLCTRCIDAAEKRAYARALAVASPLAAAVVELVETTAADARAAADRYITREFPAIADLLAEEFAAAAHAVDAVTHAEETGARVATVEDAEALFAAQLVTEAEATAGTWRGEWIGQQPDDALFALEPAAAEQGALFAP